MLQQFALSDTNNASGFKKYSTILQTKQSHERDPKSQENPVNMFKTKTTHFRQEMTVDVRKIKLHFEKPLKRPENTSRKI